ncbi:autotransporter domain-containing protein [Kordiimonas sp. SCSIO 12603]|uniref:beta strand repeat-containing protein n=1 Tax=Kordiimonas sp. SCSIO 12603 TaxID=2829596 RepID=UPI0021067CCE|nr:autotransporter domain-containing protein [Kordiimonas sp. SCSIO 12603]UTW60318.1 autotransporter domain-containing protein [Kordiimonas sp. SCSIO 12603]
MSYSLSHNKSRKLMLAASVSTIAFLSTAAVAQTEVPNGNTATVNSTADNETIVVTSGSSSTVAANPVINIINSGVIFNNGGTISTTGVTQTVNVGTGGLNATINNAAGAIIQGESRAVNLTVDGTTLNNSGSILGTGDQRNGTIYANRTADNYTINNNAGGVIDAGAGNNGAGVALELDGSVNATINNAGTIQGRGQDAAPANTAGDGLRFQGPGLAPIYLFTGTINNSGTIASEGASGPVAGVRFNNAIAFQGTFENSGTISGVNNGVYFGDSEHTGGTLTNTGTISSGSRALNIDGSDLTINNSGNIIGTGNQRNGTVYADSTAQNFTLNNQTGGVIDAGEGNEGAGFSVELSAEGNDFTITNAGTIQGRGQASAGAATAGDGLRFERTRVDGALDGSTTGLFTGTITNSGTIDSEATAGTTAGIRFVNGVSFQGTLTNEEGGTISGVNNGLYFGNPVPTGGADHTGGVVNNAGTISSDSRALNIDGSGLAVNNSGDIVGTGNQRNGTVYSDITAQDFTLNNTGTIDAGAGNEGAGFSAQLSADGNDFTITNSGTIQGRGQASAGAATAGDGIRFERTRVDGALDGSTTGLFTGTITNSGTIDSEATAGTTAGIRFVNGVSFQGTLTNEEGGTISGVNNGLYFGNAVPTGGADHTGGVVNNAGTISSDSRALNIDGTGLVVNNSGNIVGTGNQRNGTVYSDITAQSFTLNNSGTIDAGEGNEGAGFSAQLSADGSNFVIDNSGTIQGRGQASAGTATAGDGIRLERTRVDGAFDGSSTGTFTGVITNSGTINSEATAGTTGGFRAVNGVNFQGALVNEEGGTISGVNNGVYFGTGNHDGGLVDGVDFGGGLTNRGTISSDSRALNIDGTNLSVVNSGNILGTGNQRNGTVYADITAQDFNLNNSGTIDAGAGNEGAGFSAQLSADGNDFTITNSGTIQGRGQASAGAATAGDGIRFERTRVDGALDGSTTGLFTGTITNSGLINSEATAGTTAGIRFVNGVSFQGTLTNEAGGVISGVNNGLYFGNPVPAGGADHTGGVVNNAGTISSDSRALNIDGTGLVVNNSGSILGTGDQRNGTVYFDGTANNITLNNTGTIDAGAGNNGSGVSIQALAGTRTHTITNSGTIQGRGDALASGASAGIRAFYPPNMMRPEVDLTIDNSGAVASETSAGILLENITFTGSITNSGTISGATAAIDTRTSLGNVIINQTGGALNGDVLTGSGNDVLNITGGAINGNIDLGTGDNQVNINAANLVVDAARTINSDVAVNGGLNFTQDGTLAVTGDVALGANSTIAQDIADVTQVNFGTTQTLLTATGDLTGSANFTGDNSFLVDFALATTGNSITLTPTVANLSNVSSDANINGFASAFTGALTSGSGNTAFGTIANAVNGFTSNDQFTGATESLLPTLNAGIVREVYETQNQVLSLIEDRFSGFGENAGFGLWGQAFGRTADQDGENNLSQTGYDADAYGFVIGLDTAVSDDVRAGVAFSYSDIDIDEVGGAGEVTGIDSYSINAYAGYDDGTSFLNSSLSYVFGNADSARLSTFDETIRGEFDVNEFSAKVVGGIKTDFSGIEVTPFASLQYASVDQDDYQEAGGLGLNIEADSVSYFEGGVGVKFAAPTDFGSYKLLPQLSVGYYYDFAGDERTLGASFAGSNNFNLIGADPSQSSFEVDASVALLAERGTTISLGYDGEFRSGFDSHAATIRARFRF